MTRVAFIGLGVMGRRIVWSDDDIQKLSRKFVCVADEAFLLGPPKWFKPKWLPPAGQRSLRLFQTFKRNAPAGVIPNGPTVQGVYCMTADCEFLSGFFAWAFRDRAGR